MVTPDGSLVQGWSATYAQSGAEVTAIDAVELPSFLQVHRKLKSKVDYRILDFYEIPDAGLSRVIGTVPSDGLMLRG